MTWISRIEGWLEAHGTAKKSTMTQHLIHVAVQCYQSQLQKVARAPVRRTMSMRETSRSFKTFAKVVDTCVLNKWLIGEYIAAQFAMMPHNQVPLLCHLASHNARHRYIRFREMLAKRPILSAVAPSEEALIQRATFTTAQNLVVLCLARQGPALTLDDFALCDRYTLAYLFKISMLPAEFHLPPDAAAEVDLLELSEWRWPLLEKACQTAAARAIRGLDAVPGAGERLARLRAATVQSLTDLYDLPHGDSQPLVQHQP